MVTKAYRILTLSGMDILVCLLCDRWTRHPDDIAKHYCGWCHTWLDAVPDDFRRPDEENGPRRHLLEEPCA